MFEAKTYAKIAYDAILYYLTTGDLKSVNPEEIPTDLKLKIPCFVAIFDDKNLLKGIAGSIVMESENLHTEITKKAIQAATTSTEQNQISVTELSDLKTEVYLLSTIGKLNSIDELKPQKSGLILNHDNKKYYLFPDIDKAKRPEKMIDKLFSKANIKYSGKIEDYDIDSFRITKYD